MQLATITIAAISNADTGLGDLSFVIAFIGAGQSGAEGFWVLTAMGIPVGVEIGTPLPEIVQTLRVPWRLRVTHEKHVQSLILRNMALSARPTPLRSFDRRGPSRASQKPLGLGAIDPLTLDHDAPRARIAACMIT